DSPVKTRPKSSDLSEVLRRDRLEAGPRQPHAVVRLALDQASVFEAVDDARVLDAPVRPDELRAAAGLGRGPDKGVLASFEREQHVALRWPEVARVSHRGP